MVELDENGYANICKKPKETVVTRQRAPLVYSLNASIYVMTRDFLMFNNETLSGRKIIYEMPDITVDIDRELDFQFIDFLLKNELFKFDY